MASGAMWCGAAALHAPWHWLGHEWLQCHLPFTMPFAWCQVLSSLTSCGIFVSTEGRRCCVLPCWHMASPRGNHTARAACSRLSLAILVSRKRVSQPVICGLQPVTYMLWRHATCTTFPIWNVLSFGIGTDVGGHSREGSTTARPQRQLLGKQTCFAGPTIVAVTASKSPLALCDSGNVGLGPTMPAVHVSRMGNNALSSAPAAACAALLLWLSTFLLGRLRRRRCTHRSRGFPVAGVTYMTRGACPGRIHRDSTLASATQVPRRRHVRTGRRRFGM